MERKTAIIHTSNFLSSSFTQLRTELAYIAMKLYPTPSNHQHLQQDDHHSHLPSMIFVGLISAFPTFAVLLLSFQRFLMLFCYRYTNLMHDYDNISLGVLLCILANFFPQTTFLARRLV